MNVADRRRTLGFPTVWNIFCHHFHFSSFGAKTSDCFRIVQMVKKRKVFVARNKNPTSARPNRKMIRVPPVGVTSCLKINYSYRISFQRRPDFNYNFSMFPILRRIRQVSIIIFIKNLSTVFYHSPMEDTIAVITGFICA